MTRDLDCTHFQAVLGLMTYVLAFALAPLVTSAFSEEYGRQPLYQASIVIFLAMHVAIARSARLLSFEMFSVAYRSLLGRPTSKLSPLLD